MDIDDFAILLDFADFKAFLSSAFDFPRTMGGSVTRVCLWSLSGTNFTNSPLEIMNQTNPVKSRFMHY